MPPPKRTFTTSSLTSSLKSTLASQPLLSNLTSIDKLSTQASSLAQKAPFFSAINQQIQQHIQQQQSQDSPGQQHYPINSPSTTTTTSDPANVAPGDKTINSLPFSISGSACADGPSTSSSSRDMNRDVHRNNAVGGGGGNRAPMGNAPEVDMSHLTEEERAMIQSVMAKAEMADMGMPVDTSTPSSTNLPSSTSCALTYQRDFQQQQQKSQQLHQPQQQQQQQQQPLPQPQNMGPTNTSSQPPQHNMRMQTDVNQGESSAMAQYQFGQPMGAIVQHQAQSQPMSNLSDQNNNIHTPQGINQQNDGQRQQQEALSFNGNQMAPQTMSDSVMSFPQTCELPSRLSALELQGEQIPDQNLRMQPGCQSNMVHVQNATQTTSGHLPANHYQGRDNHNIDVLIPFAQSDMRQQQLPQNFITQDSNIPAQLPVQLPIQFQQPVNQPTSGQYECVNQMIPTEQFETTKNTQIIGDVSEYSRPIGQQYFEPPDSFQARTDSSSPFIQPYIAQQPRISGHQKSSDHQRTHPRYASASELDYERALSDRDYRQLTGKHNANQRAYSKSRHESMESGRRSAKEPRNTSDVRELQAYDLAQQRSTTSSHKSRQLPQPGHSGHSSNKQQVAEHIISPSDNTTREKSKQKSRGSRSQHVKTQEKPQSRHKVAEKSINQASACFSDCDLTDDTRTESESDAMNTCPVQVSGREGQLKDRVEGTVDKNIVTTEVAKSDQTLKLLSELKLTEQANQVMAQQQLLIKQSQELIRLQQAQLEQQAEINKTLSVTEREKLKSKKEKPTSSAEIESGRDEVEALTHQNDTQEGTTDAIDGGSQEELEVKSRQTAKGLGTDKNRDKSQETKEESSADGRERPASESRDVESTSDLDRGRRPGDKVISKSQRQTPSNPKVRSMSALTRKQTRDSIHSPTDTTDSDIDLMSQTSSLHHRNKTPVKSTPVARVRREPKGLPPSPLPVSAAIQLHQMQQRYRNQTTWSSMNRSSQLRSRSVTSSPNHMLDRLTSDYTTDTHRRRPTSPDTMSEYGGLRRRKRLPEPPANVIPITPSIVRQMIQANRAAAANSERIANMNKKTTMLPSSLASISHTRDGELDLRSNSSIGYRPSYECSSSEFATSLAPIGRATTIGSQKMLPDESGWTSRANRMSEIDSFPKPSYSILDKRPILGLTQISDVKETPELDKLISNLDEFYGLNSSLNKHITPSRVPYTRTFRSTSKLEPKFEPLSPILSPMESIAKTSGYLRDPLAQTQYDSHSYPSGPTNCLPTSRYNEITGYQTHSSYDPRYNQRNGSEVKPYTSMSNSNDRPSVACSSSQNYVPSIFYATQASNPINEPSESNFNDSIGRAGGHTPTDYRWTQYPAASYNYQAMRAEPGVPLDPRPARMMQMHSRDQSVPSPTRLSNYLANSDQSCNNYQTDYNQRQAAESKHLRINSNSRADNLNDLYTNSLTPITKDDIINNGPKYNSIGYRFRTENQNKYVTELRTPIECLQSRYPYPYKRILLSKNPKDRLGNGIGVKIVGGHPLPNIYDKVNKCILTSGAFVIEVFQSSRVYFMNEMHEGDQIIEWNGVNLCNRGNGEVQQILLSQFSDDEVEIIYLKRHKFREAYGIDLLVDPHLAQDYQVYQTTSGDFEAFSAMNRPTSYNIHGHSVSEPFKRSIRRRLSLSSISHMWSKRSVS